MRYIGFIEILVEAPDERILQATVENVAAELVMNDTDYPEIVNAHASDTWIKIEVEGGTTTDQDNSQ